MMDLIASFQTIGNYDLNRKELNARAQKWFHNNYG